MHRRQFMQSLLGITTTQALPSVAALNSVIGSRSAGEQVDVLYNRENQNAVTGIPSGFIELDRMTAGLQPGNLIIIAGRPSMGKTSLAMNIVEHVAMVAKLPVAVFSMEMSAVQLIMRMLGSIGRLDQHRLKVGRLDDKDWEKLSHAMGRLHEAPLYIDDSPTLKASDIRACAQRLKRACPVTGLGLIIVDYLQLMRGDAYTDNRVLELSKISCALKGLAMQLHVPIIALSQLNRQIKERPNKRPIMSDLCHSGAWAQYADLILFIYRDEVYNPDSPDRGSAEILIRKHLNGPTGSVKLSFISASMRFENSFITTAST